MKFYRIGIVLVLLILAGFVITMLALPTKGRADSSHVYIGVWDWDTDLEAWAVLPQSKTQLQSFDLRNLDQQGTPGTKGDRTCCVLVSSPDTIDDTDFLFLGVTDSADKLLSKELVDTVQKKFQLAFPISATTLSELIYELVEVQADASGKTRWKPVIADSNRIVNFSFAGLDYSKPAMDGTIEWAQTVGVLRDDYDAQRTTSLAVGDEIYKKALAKAAEKYDVDYKTFLGLNPDEGIIAPSTVNTENWNCANSSNMDCQQDWSELNGGTGWTITSNQADLTGNVGNQYASITGAPLSTTDQYSKGTLTTLSYNSAVMNLGVYCRQDYTQTSTLTFYEAKADRPSGLNRYLLHKSVTGTETTLVVVDTTTPAVNDIVQVRVDGSTISILVNGTIVGSVVDTSITSNLTCGIHGRLTNSGNHVSMDTFEDGDYQTPTPTPTNTPTATPTFTPTPTPTSTSTPTPTPTPTITPTPTPVPTSTPYPTNTPYPTSTPYPTPTPVTNINAFQQCNINSQVPNDCTVSWNWSIIMWPFIILGFVAIGEALNPMWFFGAVAASLAYIPNATNIYEYCFIFVVVVYSFARWALDYNDRRRKAGR